MAEIPVYDADIDELQSLAVGLGSDDAFERLNLDPKLYKDVQIQVISNENGQYFVQLQTVKPFNEPFLNLLLEANWQDGGHLVREFTALVDPPYIANTAVQTIDTPTVILSPVVAEPVYAAPIVRTPSIPTGSPTDPSKTAAHSSSKTETVKPSKPKLKPAKPKMADADPAPAKTAITPPKQTVQIPATASNQLVVEQGDNLSKIAGRQQQQLERSSISLNQMMNAIQRANPEAFINGNKNLLKSGSIIRLPNEQQVMALLPEDAADLLQKQWANKIMAQPAPVLSSANKLNANTTSTQAKPAQAKVVYNQGRLKIIPTEGTMNNAGSQSGASKSGQGQELRAENSLSQEDGAARQAEMATLKNQLTEAEKLQVESKRLIELQSSQIKQLTKRMQDLEKSGNAQTNAAVATQLSQAADAGKIANANAWYFSPFALLGGLLLVAGLLGFLLRRKR